MAPFWKVKKQNFFCKDSVIGTPNFIFKNKCVMEIDGSSEPAEDDTDGGVWIVTRSVSNRNYPG